MTAARLLSSWFDSDMVMGVAWGTTLAAVSRYLVPKPTRGAAVVQLNGAANMRTSGVEYASDLISSFGAAFGAAVHHFSVPAFFDYPETKAAMWRERSVRRVLDMQRRADIAVFSVGAVAGAVPSHVYSAGYLDETDIAVLHDEGVVGDVCTVFLRADGSWQDVALNARATGPDPGRAAARPAPRCASSRATTRSRRCSPRCARGSSPTSSSTRSPPDCSWTQADARARSPDATGAARRARPAYRCARDLAPSPRRPIRRPALPADVRAIRRLVQPYADERILLAKEWVGYYEAVQEFLVAERRRATVVGLRRAARHVGGPRRDPHARRRPRAARPAASGTRCSTRCSTGARGLGLRRVFCLTFEVDFFAAHGFHEIEGTPVAAGRVRRAAALARRRRRRVPRPRAREAQHPRQHPHAPRSLLTRRRLRATARLGGRPAGYRVVRPGGRRRPASTAGRRRRGASGAGRAGRRPATSAATACCGTGPSASRSSAMTRPRACRSVPVHACVRRRCACSSGRAAGGEPPARSRAPGRPRTAGCAPCRPARRAPSTRPPSVPPSASSSGHQGGRPPGLGRRERRRRQRRAGRDAGQHPAHVRVEHDRPPAERERRAPPRPCTAPTPGQREQRGLVVRAPRRRAARRPPGRTPAGAAPGAGSPAGPTRAARRPSGRRPGPRASATRPSTRATRARRGPPASAAASPR